MVLEIKLEDERSRYQHYKMNRDKLQMRILIEESRACLKLKLIPLKLRG